MLAAAASSISSFGFGPVERKSSSQSAAAFHCAGRRSASSLKASSAVTLTFSVSHSTAPTLWPSTIRSTGRKARPLGLLARLFLIGRNNQDQRLVGDAILLESVQDAPNRGVRLHHKVAV